MSNETIGGVEETMLQALYARAKESKKQIINFAMIKPLRSSAGWTMTFPFLNPKFVKKNVEKSI